MNRPLPNACRAALFTCWLSVLSLPIQLLAAPPAEAPLVEAPGAGGKLPASLSKAVIVFRDDAGRELYTLKAKAENVAKLYDAQGKELGKLTLSADKIKAKSADDKPLFELKRKEDKIMIKDANDKELLKLKLKGDTVDVYAANEQRLYRLKKHGVEWVLEDKSGQVRARTGLQNGKPAARDVQNKTVLESAELTDPFGLAFFQMRELSALQQSACLLFFLRE